MPRIFNANQRNKIKAKNVFCLLLIVLCAAVLSSGQVSLIEKKRSKVSVVVPSSELDTAVTLLEGNVVIVQDGDTVSLAVKDGSIYSIRLQGIDAPETSQAYGRESTLQLSALIQGMNVTAVVRKRDSEGRYIAAVFFDGQDVSLLQLKAGMAWNLPGYNFDTASDSFDVYNKAEQSARGAKIGLWRDSDPVAPWDFLSKKDRDADKSSTSASKTPSETEVEKNSPSTSPKSSPITAPPRKYILGPRGGCYYLNERGIKVYVSNKSLCGKSE